MNTATFVRRAQAAARKAIASLAAADVVSAVKAAEVASKAAADLDDLLMAIGVPCETNRDAAKATSAARRAAQAAYCATCAYNQLVENATMGARFADDATMT